MACVMVLLSKPFSHSILMAQPILIHLQHLNTSFTSTTSLLFPALWHPAAFSASFCFSVPSNYFSFLICLLVVSVDLHTAVFNPAAILLPAAVLTHIPCQLSSSPFQFDWCFEIFSFSTLCLLCTLLLALENLFTFHSFFLLSIPSQ